MKKLLLLLIIPFVTIGAFAQTRPAAVITPKFTDSVTQNIKKIIPANYTIKILYGSPVSEQGKLTDPKIMRQKDSEGTEADNAFVVKLRLILMKAPAWTPAKDASTGKPIVSKTLFVISIKDGKTDIVTGAPGEEFKLLTTF